jgi:hypothetical protein
VTVLNTLVAAGALFVWPMTVPEAIEPQASAMLKICRYFSLSDFFVDFINWISNGFLLELPLPPGLLGTNTILGRPGVKLVLRTGI